MTALSVTVAGRGLSSDQVPEPQFVRYEPRSGRLRVWLILSGLWLSFLWVLSLSEQGAPAGGRVLAATGAAALIAGVGWVLRRHYTAPLQQSQPLLHLLAEIVDTRERAVYGHSWRVAAYSRDIAVALGLSMAAADQVSQAGLLHDVGKVGVPDAVLNKPGPLDPAERTLMMGHAAAGARIVGHAGPLASLEPLIRHHHEWWSGDGYPDGLAGQAIPLGARIVAVADAFDTMTTDRPYRGRRGQGDALAELRRCAGRQFDPAAVAALAGVLVEVADTPTTAPPDRPTLVEQAMPIGLLSRP